MLCRAPIVALLATAMTFAAEGLLIPCDISVDQRIASVTVVGNESGGPFSQTFARSTHRNMELEVGTAYTPTFTNVDTGYTPQWSITTNGQSTLSGGANNAITIPSDAYSGCALRFYGEANTYAVTLNQQSGSGGTASVTVTYDAAMPAITVPTRTGYNFGGYYTGTNGSGTQYYKADGTSARNWDKTSATTLYAKWTAIGYTVTLNQQSGTGGTTSVRATYGEAMPAITVPTRAGYNFGGYYLGQNGSGTQYYTASGASARSWDVASSRTLWAKWTAISYTVTLNQQSGTGGTTSVRATYGEAMPAITVPTRTGHTFGGYYLGQDGSGAQYYTASGASARSWDVASSRTLWAKWTANSYTVTLNRQSGTGGTGSLTATYGEAMPAITVPTRTGYNFGGYYTAANGGGTQYYTATGASARIWDKTVNTELYAKWTAISSTVTLNMQSGSGGTASVTATYGSAMPSATMPTRAGYTFGGYYTAANGGGTQYYTATGTSARNWDKTSATTLYAKWIQNPIVTFVLNGGTFQNGWMTPTNYVEGVGMNLPTAADITYTNRAFIGWYEDEMCLGDRVTRISSSDQGDRTFYARWEGRSYKVSFDVNGGKGRDHQEQSLSMTNSERLKTLAELYVTPQDGYTFAEWNTAVDGSGDSYSDGAVIENNLTNVAAATVMLYAQWTPNPYEVAFQPNGGEGSMDNQSFIYDVTQALDHVTFTRTGYAFKEWTNATNHNYQTEHYLDGEEVANLATGGVANLYANWTGIVYTVTFDANGGEGTMDSMLCTYDAPTNLPACAFTRDGWGFKGWTTNGAEGVLFADGARVTNLTTAAEVTLLACWTGVTYQVTLDARDPQGNVDNNGVFTNDMGEAVSLWTNAYYTVGDAWMLPVPTNVNVDYVFAGWKYGNGQLADGEVPPPSTGSTNLVATWTWVTGEIAAAVDAPEMGFRTFGTVGDRGDADDPAYSAVWFAQTNCFVRDGISTNAVQSGALPENAGTRYRFVSWLTTTVEGRGALSFSWKCAAKPYDDGEDSGDRFRFGRFNEQGWFTEITNLQGNVDWARYTHTNETDNAVTFAWAFTFDDNDQGVNSGGGTGWVDRVTWVPEGASGEATPTHGVPYSWLRDHFSNAGSMSDAQLEDLAESDSPSGKSMKVWEDYWAGTDPNDPNDLFRALIAVSNDVARITWLPDLSVAGNPVRVYHVLSAPTLSAGWAVLQSNVVEELAVEVPGSGASGSPTNCFFKVELDWRRSLEN